MFKVVKFKPEHGMTLLEEPINRHLSQWRVDDYAHMRKIESGSLALTGLVNNKPMICVFIVDIWSSRGYAVVILSELIRQNSLAVYRGIKNYMVKLPYNRIEFDTPCEYDLGHRRAEFLGFEIMCARARRYLPDGRDASVYQWVRP